MSCKNGGLLAHYFFRIAKPVTVSQLGSNLEPESEMLDTRTKVLLPFFKIILYQPFTPKTSVNMFIPLAATSHIQWPICSPYASFWTVLDNPYFL